MKSETQARLDFQSRLDAMLDAIKRHAMSQFQYSMVNNIHNPLIGINTENVAEHSVTHGVVAGTSELNKWDNDKARELCYKILEDNNMSDECKAFQDAIARLEWGEH